MCSAGPFQFKWLKGCIHSSCYYHQIGSINITHCYCVFFRDYVPEMFVTWYSVTYCIFIPGKPGFCFHYYCAVYNECKESHTFWLEDSVRLFVHYTISLSSLCKLICRHWTYEMTVRYILSTLWLRLRMFSYLSIIQYMGLCVFGLPISVVMIERKYILSYYHHQIASMNYYLLFRARPWYNGTLYVFLYSYLIELVSG